LNIFFITLEGLFYCEILPIIYLNIFYVSGSKASQVQGSG